MKRRIHRALVWLSRIACVAAIALSIGPRTATASSSFTLDLSDLWWNPTEAGWGAQLVHQHLTVFATMFVYAQNGQPEFYVATLARAPNFVDWVGPLYRTTGPWWGGAFDPATVVESEVGTMTFHSQGTSSGRFDYTIGGVAVSKSVLRMSFANDRIAGTYVGGARYTVASGACAGAGATPATASFALSEGVTASAALAIGDRVCNAPAVSYLQQGQYARMTGAYTCTNGETGEATLTNVKVMTDSVSFNWRLAGSGPGYTCQIDGEFAGVLQLE